MEVLKVIRVVPGIIQVMDDHDLVLKLTVTLGSSIFSDLHTCYLCFFFEQQKIFSSNSTHPNAQMLKSDENLHRVHVQMRHV